MKTLKIIRLIINILLAIGCFAVFSEGNSFKPNLFGIGCFVLLIAINPSGVDWMRTNSDK